MAILVIFRVFLGIEWPLANLGLIDLKIGLYIKVNVNVGQNKFNSISNNLAKMAINLHKIGQMPIGHFSSNFDIIFF